MKLLQKIVPIALALVLCLFFVISIVDTEETVKETNFSRDNIQTHLDHFTENGPRSIADTEANAAMLDYIAASLESYGLVNEDTTAAPAYVRQDLVAKDTEYQNWYLQNIIVHIPANSDPTGDAVMFMGHIDSVPMGPGASDDGVACAVMLEAIRYYTDRIADGYKLQNDLVFCFVNGEEYGMYGSSAFMEEFKGFHNIVDRIKFGTNLESRGTSGTLIMFETGKNNYNTVKLFSEVNENVFTCSIATMVYDMMPNYTDFTNFKEVYQGVNMANITGGENYHTQNDSFENVGKVYVSQQAQIVDGLIDRLSSYELDRLYDADESAIFFSYLNLTTVVYDHTVSVVLAVLGILLLLANIVLSVVNKQKNLKKTALGFVTIVAGLALSAAAAFICYYLFQYIAVLFGTIDIHMVGTITYSNITIVVGIGLLTLAMTALAVHIACKKLKIEGRDITRAFAYLHVFLGIVLSFVLPDAGYLFMFSGLLLMANELAVTLLKKSGYEKLHLELLVTALYFPIIVPIIFLATSALGLTMAYVYGLVFALAIFDIAVCVAPLCKYLSVRSLIRATRRKDAAVPAVEGVCHILTASLVIFLCVCLAKPNASVNLQGKQNLAKLPYDDALVYVVDEEAGDEYRIYDLNAYSALEAYAPEMEYAGEYYVGEGKAQSVANSILSTAEGNVLTVQKTDEASTVYLVFGEGNATSITVDDGKTQNTYDIEAGFIFTIHSDCTVTVNGGSIAFEYREVIRDYESLIPAAYAEDDEQLHFNLWLTRNVTLG
ncbi:MAG: M20/M25/M40 family metallo-hydrolase [Clostridia bacterium]|nr:M20/M25/M40 family metallo-hydrolase [Clostridia bacterium]